MKKRCEEHLATICSCSARSRHEYVLLIVKRIEIGKPYDVRNDLSDDRLWEGLLSPLIDEARALTHY